MFSIFDLPPFHSTVYAIELDRGLALGEDARGTKTGVRIAMLPVKVNKYSYLFFVGMVLGSGVFVPQGGGEPRSVDRIVAIVGEHAVLYSEAKAKMDGGQLVSVSDFPSPSTASRTARAINDLINTQLVKDALADLDLQVSDAETEREIAAFLKQKELVRADLDAFLRSQGKTYEIYKQDFNNQLVLRKFHGALILPMINVTDEDVRTHYLKKSGRVGDLVTFELRQIFTTDEQRLREAYQRLQQGTSFAVVSELYHDQRHRTTMQGVHLQDLSSDLRVALRALQEGQYSPPLATEAGHHIFYVVKRQLSVDSDFTARKAELEMELKQLELATQTRIWLQKKRAATNIKLLYP